MICAHRFYVLYFVRHTEQLKTEEQERISGIEIRTLTRIRREPIRQRTHGMLAHKDATL